MFCLFFYMKIYSYLKNKKLEFQNLALWGAWAFDGPQTSAYLFITPDLV